jgi:hypothetical protein
LVANVDDVVVDDVDVDAEFDNVGNVDRNDEGNASPQHACN